MRPLLCVVMACVLAYVAPCSAEAVGRPVRVVSIGFQEGKPVDEVAATVAAQGEQGADLIVLPETWSGHGKPIQTIEGPAVATMAGLARKYHTYIVCAMDRLDGEKRLNSAVLLDREGRVVGVYDKVFPYWSEYSLDPPVTPAADVPVFDTDFGKLGMAICFDVNFPEVWQRLADKGAELVVWPSAYSAGTSLQAHALNHHYYIVSATQRSDCAVYDITGEQLLYEQHEPMNVSRITLDLDRGIFHQNFNDDKRKRLIGEHEGDIQIDKWMDREQWFVLRAKRPGVSARALAHEYGLEELRDYITRSRKAIDAERGGRLVDRVWASEQ